MRLHAMIAPISAILTLSGCASGPRQTTTYNDALIPRWSGSLQAQQQRSGQLQPMGQIRASGTVTIQPTEGGTLKRMHVSMTVSISGAGSKSLRWAILPDRCGNGELPIIGFEQYPLIEMNTNERGQVDADLPLELSPQNTYHVNVYNGGQQLDNVITCGNLRFENTQGR